MAGLQDFWQDYRTSAILAVMQLVPMPQLCFLYWLEIKKKLYSILDMCASKLAVIDVRPSFLSFNHPRLWGHCCGKPVSRFARPHPKVEFSAIWLQVGPQAGSALLMRGVQPGCLIRCSLRAKQGTSSQCNSVRLSPGTKPSPRTSWCFS